MAVVADVADAVAYQLLLVHRHSLVAPHPTDMVVSPRCTTVLCLPVGQKRADVAL